MVTAVKLTTPLVFFDYWYTSTMSNIKLNAHLKAGSLTQKDDTKPNTHIHDKYTLKHIHTYTHTHTHAHRHVYTCTHIFTHLPPHTTNKNTYACMHIHCMCTHKCTHAHSFTPTHTYTNKHTNMQTHTHTHRYIYVFVGNLFSCSICSVYFTNLM